MSEIVEFLRARLDEDEQVARAALGRAAFFGNTGEWIADQVRDPNGPIPLIFALSGAGARTQVADLSHAHDPDERGTHIARHDPARVLREVEAKRRIIERYEADRADFQRHDGYQRNAAMSAARMEISEQALRALAAAYSDHSEYQPHWKP